MAAAGADWMHANRRCSEGLKKCAGCAWIAKGNTAALVFQAHRLADYTFPL